MVIFSTALGASLILIARRDSIFGNPRACTHGPSTKTIYARPFFGWSPGIKIIWPAAHPIWTAGVAGIATRACTPVCCRTQY
jgi:hypothetical protein